MLMVAGPTRRGPKRAQQINTRHVKALQTGRVWSIECARRSKTTHTWPHRGIIYLTNVGTKHIAGVSRRTGDLIWENRLRPQGSTGRAERAAMRNLAIYRKGF